MAVITIIIEESAEQLISGIPRYLTFSANIPSSIFYTFDGTDPTTSSTIYVGGELETPRDIMSLVVKLFATNGTDSSPIITRNYYPNVVPIRQSHDEVLNLDTSPCCNKDNSFPYSDRGPSLPVEYGNIAGDIVHRPGVQGIPSGYDGTGTLSPAGETDKPIEQYKILYSESNDRGERGHGIGTLPSEVTIQKVPAPPEESSSNDRFFNAKALVIYQDNTQPNDNNDVCQINRPFFSLENSERTKDGILLDTTAMEGLVPTGNFVRACFNPNTQTLTYYYFDSQTLRWIISKEPYDPTTNKAGALYSIIFSSRSVGDRYVYKWRPFAGRRLI